MPDDIDVSKWPAAFQYLAMLGAAIAGGVMYVRGLRSKNKPDAESSDRLQARLDDASLRQDLQKVFEAERRAIETRLDRMAEANRQDIETLWKEFRRLEREFWQRRNEA